MPKTPLDALEQTARAIVEAIDPVLRRKHGRQIGIALWLYEFGRGGFMTYIGNGDRDDMERVAIEWLEHRAAERHGCSLEELLERTARQRAAERGSGHG